MLYFKVTDAEGREPIHVRLASEPERVDALVPGKYTLEVRGDGIEPARREVEIEPGRETAVELDIEAGKGPA